MDAKVTVPVSPSEMAAIRNLVSYVLPRLMGFDIVCDGMHTMAAMEAPDSY